MKKVGLITFHESDNYGTCLQAYSLQEMIFKQGYKCEILNYKRKNIIKKNNLLTISKMKNILKLYGINIFKYLKVKEASIDKKKQFIEFRKNNFKYSYKIYNSYEEIKAVEKEYFKFVCGSDMIWNFERIDDERIYFLKFTNKAKKIAYAPSIGKSNFQIEERVRYKKLLESFGSLSCREKSGVNFLERDLKLKCSWVLDPTLIIDKSLWDRFIQNNDNEKYLLCYLFGGVSKDFFKRIKILGKNLKLKIKIIPMDSKDFNYNESLKGIGPSEFINLFANSQFILTNSYHGLLFSFIFGKQFYLLEREELEHWSKFQERMISILKELNLEERMVESKDINILEGLESIDYKKVNKKLDILKTKSIEYLNQSLKGDH